MFISFHQFCKEGNPVFRDELKAGMLLMAAVLFIVLFRIMFFIDVSINAKNLYWYNCNPAFNNTGGSRC